MAKSELYSHKGSQLVFMFEIRIGADLNLCHKKIWAHCQVHKPFLVLWSEVVLRQTSYNATNSGVGLLAYRSIWGEERYV